MTDHDTPEGSGLVYQAKKAAGKAKRKKGGRQPRSTVVLSGGAPNSPLMSGALAAIYERGKTFNVFFTSGAGVLGGLLYISPKMKPAPNALISSLNNAIPEPLWSLFPIDYNVFLKSGPWTQMCQALGNALKISGPTWPPHRDLERWYNNTISFWTAVWTPTTLNYFSKGICESTPLADETVDFPGIQDFKGDFFMNAYNITKAKTRQFRKAEIGPDEVKATISYPFVYPPFKLGDSYYFEGSSINPLNLPVLTENIARDEIETDSVVIIDLLGAYRKPLIRVPRNLINAFGISIMTPLVSLSEKEIRIFIDDCEKAGHPFDLYMMRFKIPESQWPFVIDFSYQNMWALWNIGYETGMAFCDGHGHILPDREPGGPNPVSP